MIQTRQREVILNVLHDAGRPLAREEILKLGRQQIDRLGSATVDRAIREMTDDFCIIGVEFLVNQNATSYLQSPNIRTLYAEHARESSTYRLQWSCPKLKCLKVSRF